MKRLIIAVVILAGLIVYWRWPVKKQAAAATPVLAKFDAGQAHRIAVDQAGQPEVILDKVNGHWRLAQPYSAAADAEAVSTLLTTASSIDPAETLGAEKNLAPFGLNAPATVTVTLANGRQYQFEFGADTPTGGNQYLKLGDAPAVYTVASYVKGDMVKNAFALRDKSLLQFASDDVNSLRLTYKGKEFSFARKNGKWPASEADNIQSLTDALSNAQMDALVDPTGKDAAKYGLTRPTADITLNWTGGRGELQIGAKKGAAEYYARASGSPAIFTLSSYLLDDVQTLAAPPPAPPVVKTAVKSAASARHESKKAAAK